MHTNSVRTSQETHYVTATKSNRLMLIRETVAAFCESHMEHTYYIYINSVRTSRKHFYVSDTKPNRLMLLGETVGVFNERIIRTHKYTLWVKCIVLMC
jgi:hypothetical protein